MIPPTDLYPQPLSQGTMEAKFSPRGRPEDLDLTADLEAVIDEYKPLLDALDD